MLSCGSFRKLLQDIHVTSKYINTKFIDRVFIIINEDDMELHNADLQNIDSHKSEEHNEDTEVYTLLSFTFPW